MQSCKECFSVFALKIQYRIKKKQNTVIFTKMNRNRIKAINLELIQRQFDDSLKYNVMNERRQGWYGGERSEMHDV